MTVAELIAELSRLPPDMEVLAESYDQYCVPVEGAERVATHSIDAVVIRTSDGGDVENADELY